MALDTGISLTTVDEVLAYMGISPQRDALWVYYAGANATATVQVQSTQVVLVDSGTTNILFSTYDTLTKVVNQINTVLGWVAGIIYAGAAASSNLIVTGSLNAKNLANRQTLKIRDVHLIEQLINRASDFLNRYWKRTLKTTTYALERYDGEGAKLFLRNYPVTAVVQLSKGTLDVIKVKYTSATAYNAYIEVDQGAETVKLVRDGTVDATIDISNASYDTLSELAAYISTISNWEASVLNTDYNSYPCSKLFTKLNRYCLNQYAYLQIPADPIDDYTVDYEKGIIYLSSEFNGGFQNVFVTYTAGYSTIPYTAELICIELVKYKYDLSKKDRGLQSEKIGQVYSYTLADLREALPPDLLAEADFFKRREF